MTPDRALSVVVEIASVAPPSVGHDGTVAHLTTDELTASLDEVRGSPVGRGRVELIVRRPAIGARELVVEATLTSTGGIEGDSWRERGSRHTDDGSAEFDRQITIMNSRAIALLAGSTDHDRWAEAGDQLYLDISLRDEDLPVGTRLQLGTAVIEISAKPHTGCAKFAERFGIEAARFVNSTEGSELHLRGINAFVVTDGVVHTGDSAEITTT